MAKFAVMAASSVIGSGIGMLIGGHVFGLGFIATGLWMLTQNSSEKL